MEIQQCSDSGDIKERVQQNSTDEYCVQQRSKKAMKPTTIEALLYNREAKLKDRMKTQYTIKDKMRLEEVMYLKRQIKKMLSEIRYEYQSYKI